MNVKRLGALFVAALLVMAAVPAIAARDATVGEFVIKLAKSRNLAATDAGVAGNSLRGIGVRISPNLDYSARLTEGDVTRLSRSMGLNVTTTTPDNSFSTVQVDTFFATFGNDINTKLTLIDFLTNQRSLEDAERQLGEFIDDSPEVLKLASGTE